MHMRIRTNIHTNLLDLLEVELIETVDPVGELQNDKHLEPETGLVVRIRHPQGTQHPQVILLQQSSANH